jgi:hypothetical protein
MEPVGHLEGFRSGLSAGERIGTCAIAYQDGHGRMALQPFAQPLGGATFEHRHRLLALQAHHARRIGRSSPQRKLIHTHNTRRGRNDRFRTLAADESVWARHITEPTSQSCGGLYMAGMGRFQQSLAQAFHLACITR